MTKAVIQGYIYWLNIPPSDNGVSDKLSSSEIIQVLRNPKYDKLTVYFGSYAQVHIGTKNTTKSITIGAIYLRSAGERNGYYFVSLVTGKQLHELNWTEFTIDDYVIYRVEEMARSENQSTMTNCYPIFKWAPGFPILDNDEDEN